jgi:uncharacterized membrane protein YcaP (DUF421 family)
MKKDEIEPWDWERILLGQTPAEFLFEAFLRTIVMYGFVLVILRFLGKRMDAQLTITEFAVMILLGAIISVPMQMQDKGILLGVITLTFVLLFQRGVNWLTLKNKRVENVTQGTMSTVIKNGVLQVDEMQRIALSKQNLFAELRKRQIYNLGKIKRAYFEACGLLNVYEDKGEKPGLSLLPNGENKLVQDIATVDTDKISCINCGFVTNTDGKKNSCRNCGAREWAEAIK